MWFGFCLARCLIVPLAWQGRDVKYGVMTMADLVTWRDDRSIPEQRFARVGRLDLFVVGHDQETGFMLAARGLLASGWEDGMGLVKYLPTTQEAQRAAEESVAGVLDALDVVPRSAA